MKPSLAGRLGLTVSTGELGCKSPARRSLHRGGVWARGLRLDSQLLLTRQITLLQLLLALEQALLRLHQPLLRALFLYALRLLRLQLLYALLQAVDALLTVRGLARKDIALPLLDRLLLLDALLALADQLLLRWARDRRRGARAPRCGDCRRDRRCSDLRCRT